VQTTLRVRPRMAHVAIRAPLGSLGLCPLMSNPPSCSTINPSRNCLTSPSFPRQPNPGRKRFLDTGSCRCDGNSWGRVNSGSAPGSAVIRATPADPTRFVRGTDWTTPGDFIQLGEARPASIRASAAPLDRIVLAADPDARTPCRRARRLYRSPPGRRRSAGPHPRAPRVLRRVLDRGEERTGGVVVAAEHVGCRPSHQDVMSDCANHGVAGGDAGHDLGPERARLSTGRPRSPLTGVLVRRWCRVPLASVMATGAPFCKAALLRSTVKVSGRGLDHVVVDEVNGDRPLRFPGENVTAPPGRQSPCPRWQTR